MGFDIQQARILKLEAVPRYLGCVNVDEVRNNSAFMSAFFSHNSSESEALKCQCERDSTRGAVVQFQGEVS